jgi:hypothetical protein
MLSFVNEHLVIQTTFVEKSVYINRILKMKTVSKSSTAHILKQGYILFLSDIAAGLHILQAKVLATSCSEVYNP